MKKPTNWKDYYDRLPKRPIAAGALIFDYQRRLLIVKPSYQEPWLIPGGVVEANETPRDACAREIEEETSIKVQPISLRFLAVDCTTTMAGEKGESIKFIFDGGTWNAETIARIKVDGEEITAYRFIKIAKAFKLFGGPRCGLSRRVRWALRAMPADSPVYLEEGNEY